MGRSRNHEPLRLVKADNNGDLVRISCQLCRVTRCFRPYELAKLVGDKPVEDLPRFMRCSDCGSREYLRAGTWNPSPQERNGLVIRRVASVRWVRKVEWRDEGG